jgi:hypothetical protein
MGCQRESTIAPIPSIYSLYDPSYVSDTFQLQPTTTPANSWAEPVLVNHANVDGLVNTGDPYIDQASW